MSRIFKIGSNHHTVLTLKEFAAELGKSKRTLEAWENDWLPIANIRFGKQRRKGYTKELVDELLPILSEVTQGVEVTNEIKQKVRIAFIKELSRIKL